MTENSTPEPEPMPTTVPPAPPSDVPAAPAAPAAARVPLKHRLFNFRSVVAVAAAGVILGATAGAGVTAATHHDDHRRSDRAGFGPGQMPDGGQVPGMPGQGFPGRMDGSGTTDEGSTQSG